MSTIIILEEEENDPPEEGEGPEGRSANLPFTPGRATYYSTRRLRSLRAARAAIDAMIARHVQRTDDGA
jgi:hypothetical protein